VNVIKNMQKHFGKAQCGQRGISTLVGIIIIVIVAVILFGGVFAYQYFTKFEAQNSKSETNSNVQNPNVQNETASPALSEVEGWKTYNELDFRFSFKYPATWIVDDGLTINTCCLNIFNYDPVKKQGQFQEKGEVKIQIANYKKSASISLKEFVSYKTYMESNAKATLVEDVKVAGINGIKSNLIGDGTYYLPKSSTEGISIIIFNHPESRETFKGTIDQLLVTFKFTK